MYCKHCGKELSDGSRFCIYCGKELSGESILNEACAQPNTEKPDKRWHNLEFGLMCGITTVVPFFGLLFGLWGLLTPDKRIHGVALLIWSAVAFYVYSVI